nr:EOG090X028B [Artemia franciscana]
MGNVKCCGKSQHVLPLEPNCYRLPNIHQSGLSIQLFLESFSQIFILRTLLDVIFTLNIKKRTFSSTKNINVKCHWYTIVLSKDFIIDLNLDCLCRTSLLIELLNFGLNWKSLGRNLRLVLLILREVCNSVHILVTNTNHFNVFFCTVPNSSCISQILGNFIDTISNFTNCLHYYMVIFTFYINNSIPKVFVTQQLDMKMASFELDNNPVSRTSLAERNVTLATLYGQIAVLVLRHVARQTEQKAEVIIYPILKDSSSKPSAILRLDMTGRFAINILDNLVVVHHQSSKTSVLFDIRCRPESREGVTPTFAKLGMPKTIREFYLPAADLAPFPAPERSMPVEMYASSWVIFQPDIIIDAKLGCMWKLSLLLEPLANMISDPVSCSDVLLRRTEGKTVLLGRLQRWVTGESCDLFSLGTVFDKVNEMYRQNVEIELESQMGTPVNSASYLKISTKIRPLVVVDQCDIYSQICNGKINNGDREVKVSSKTRKKCIAVTTSYIRSLIQWHLPVQHYIYELLIGLLLESDNFYQLHQMLQYHAISDSKPLACLLLSLEPKYPAAVQLAVDMLRRLGNASEEIIEVLLSQNKVLTAITYARNNGLGDSISARKFLEAVSNTGDLKAFFSVYNFFEQRNLKLRGSSIFAKGSLFYSS